MQYEPEGLALSFYTIDLAVSGSVATFAVDSNESKRDYPGNAAIPRPQGLALSYEELAFCLFMPFLAVAAEKKREGRYHPGNTPPYHIH